MSSEHGIFESSTLNDVLIIPLKKNCLENGKHVKFNLVLSNFCSVRKSTSGDSYDAVISNWRYFMEILRALADDCRKLKFDVNYELFEKILRVDIGLYLRKRSEFIDIMLKIMQSI